MFFETLNNLKRQCLDPPANLAGNTPVFNKFSDIIYGGDIRAGDRSAASQSIEDILKGMKNEASAANTRQDLRVREMTKPAYNKEQTVTQHIQKRNTTRISCPNKRRSCSSRSKLHFPNTTNVFLSKWLMQLCTNCVQVLPHTTHMRCCKLRGSVFQTITVTR